MRKIYATAVLSLVIGAPAPAAHISDLKKDCTNPKKTFFQRTAGCAADLFTLEPVKLIVYSFPPAGSIGFGARYTKQLESGAWDRSFSVAGAVSMRKFWETEAIFTATKTPPPTARLLSEQFGYHVYVRYMDLPQLSFYGLGPNTSRDNLTRFRERIGRAGGDVSQPVINALSIGGVVETLWFDVGHTNSTIPSIETRFTERTAPGLIEQPHMMRYGAFLRPHHRSGVFQLEDRVSYDFFHDFDLKRYSFHRFRADLQHYIYPFRSEGGLRRDRFLMIRGLFSTSNALSRNAVPFYLQETLGGRNIDGDPTLRGFADYRFRGPHLVLIQTEYSHRFGGGRPPAPDQPPPSLLKSIPHALGAFAFYDTGQVAQRRGDLDMGRMRHSFGGGITIFAGGVLQAKIYVGLGGGEGSHTYTVIPKF